MPPATAGSHHVDGSAAPAGRGHCDANKAVVGAAVGAVVGDPDVGAAVGAADAPHVTIQAFVRPFASTSAALLALMAVAMVCSSAAVTRTSAVTLRPRLLSRTKEAPEAVQHDAGAPKHVQSWHEDGNQLMPVQQSEQALP